MESFLISSFGHINVRVVPFLPELERFEKKNNVVDEFIYVASYDRHKNHNNLITAWAILKSKGIVPKLKLAIDFIPEDLKERVLGLNIDLIQIKSRQQLMTLYQTSTCLIHPSIFESFGIVLLEAQATNLAILAPESDYVRDVVKPTETFDPFSPRSIASSVMRYLKIEDQFIKIKSPVDFWEEVL